MAWTDSVSGGVGDAYASNWWGAGGDWLQQGLGAWLSYETIQAKADANAIRQEATRNQPTTTSSTPAPYRDTANVGTSGGGVSQTTLIVGGVMLAGLFLLAKG